MNLTAIMAVSDDNVIGVDGPKGPTLPWRLPPDLARFKRITLGHPIIMGRTTFDSIGRRPLPGRKNLVVSRAPRPEDIDASVVWCAHPMNALFAARCANAEPFVIGGAEIWSALWKHVTHVELTRVHTTVGLGRCFVFHAPLWKQTRSEGPLKHKELSYTFESYERIAEEP